MAIITWMFTKKPNVRETGGFSGRSIIAGMKRFERYWDIKFQDVTRQNPRRANITFYLTDTLKPGTIAEVHGTTIFINSLFKWVFPQQQELPMCHEIMHIYGGRNHLPPGNVMAAVAGNPYINFTEADCRYMSNFRWRSPTLRPWNEPDFWIPPKRNVVTTYFFGQRVIPEEWPQLHLCDHE